MLAMLLGCGLRRSELVGLDTDEVQMRQGHWAIVDLTGKGGHIRTVPIPQWAKQALDLWTSAAEVTKGKIFRAVNKRGKVWGRGLSANVVWYVVEGCCKRAGLEHIAPLRLATDVRQAVPRWWRRTGADTIPAGSRLSTDHGALPRLQAEPRQPRE